MNTIFIGYGTTEGQTAKIAEVIADVICGHGHRAEVVNLQASDTSIPNSADGVIVGSSIHMGSHDKHVVRFVQENLDTLEAVPSAFFSVSLAAHGDTEEAEGYLQRFEEEAGSRPGSTALFGGALLYTHYGFVKRHLMKKIAQDKPGHLGTDMTRDYVYTDWDGVSRFAEAFLTGLDTPAKTTSG